MAANRILDNFNYKESQIENAQDFLDTLGISTPKFTLDFVDAAVVWFCEKTKDKGTIFTKQELDEYNSARVKGLGELQKTKVYDKIYSEIEDTALNLGLNPATGKRTRQRRAPRPRQKQPRQGKKTGGRRQKGETDKNSPDIKLPDGPNPTDKFITTKLTDTLVYGQPKYNDVELYFKNDFDKVAYILRNKRTRSKQHDRYFEWARLVSGGQPDDVIRQHGNKVLREIKRIIGKRKTGDATINPVPLDFDPPDPNQIKNMMRAQNAPAPAGGGGGRPPGGPVSPASFMGRPGDSSGSGQPSGQNIMARSARVVRGGSYTEILDVLENIKKSVESILDLLKKQQEINADIEAANRTYLIGQQRAARESASEAFVKGLVDQAFKIIKPIQNMLERILNFIAYTLLGGAVNSLIDWLADPKNKDKVQAISRFLKDWWPILLGAYVTFFTSFGKLVKMSIAGTARLAITLGRQIPKLLKLLASLGPVGKVVAGAALAGGAIYGGYKLLSGNQNKKENKKETPSMPSVPKRSFGGIVPFIRPRKLHVNEIGFAGGGNVTDGTGVTITGAGKDTQLIAAQPGEYVISKKAVDKYGPDFFEGLNKMAGASNIPKMANNIQLAQQGGKVGKDGSGISAKDYNTLLAIAAAEDSDPQGRADVAQSLYNRLLASGGNYKMNFMPTGGIPSLANLITGDQQFEPTFENQQDWRNITDRKSAAQALAKYLAKRSNSRPDIKEAMKMLNDTEKALKDPVLQTKAKEFVGGRTSFFGTSQIGNMKKDQGDVVRPGGNNNFFSPQLEQNAKDPGGQRYYRERRNTAAPTPSAFVAPQQPRRQPTRAQGPSIFSRILGAFGAIINPTQGITTAPVPKTTPPRRRPTSRVDISYLPPLDLRYNKAQAPYQRSASVEVATFSLYPPDEISNRSYIKESLSIA